ncbi:MAG TPA: hypothetical protein VKA79_06315 [Aestuariivirgaceae bacterium]|nr:hypothetical protein [Aestuariivirgaceae bacterium]
MSWLAACAASASVILASGGTAQGIDYPQRGIQEIAYSPGSANQQTQQAPDAIWLIHDDSAWYLQARIDEVIIHSLKVNRGNCVSAHSFDQAITHRPATLKFGDILLVVTMSGCRMIELEVQTNHGVTLWKQEDIYGKEQ